MKTQLIKGLTVLGIGAVMMGAFAAGPAKADGRCNDNRSNCAVGIDVRIAPNGGGRYAGFDHGDRGRNDRRDDRGRSDNHDRR